MPTARREQCHHQSLPRRRARAMPNHRPSRLLQHPPRCYSARCRYFYMLMPHRYLFALAFIPPRWLFCHAIRSRRHVVATPRYAQRLTAYDTPPSFDVESPSVRHGSSTYVSPPRRRSYSHVVIRPTLEINIGCLQHAHTSLYATSYAYDDSARRSYMLIYAATPYMPDDLRCLSFFR